MVLTGPRLADCQAQLDGCRDHIDLAELRADLVDREDWSLLNDFSDRAGVPLILTLRTPHDGGRWCGTDDQRRAFFEAAFDGAWRWLDVEDDQRMPDLESRWLARGRELVVSFHDFDGVPPGWAPRLAAAEGPGITAKAAVFPQSSQEFLRFVEELQALGPGNRVALAMGGFGFPSRVLAARLGSRWTYTSAPGQLAAPGQIDPETLQTLYRFRRQTADTPVYGIVGNPVFHSKSPGIHNPGLGALDLPGVYLPFLVDDLKSFFSLADRLGVVGLSCTIPFKEAVLGFLSARTPAVEAIGACNTLWREPGGLWQGDNTDAPGFLVPLNDILNHRPGLKATVIGTGGAARGVVWALRSAGVTVLVLGRSLAKAQALAEEFGAEAAVLGPETLPLVERSSDLIVQTTSVGMGEASGQDPLGWYPFTGRELVYDIIYTPAWTAFLTRAAAAGCRVFFGREMLVGQARGQFLRFTGREYPEPALTV